MNQDHIRALTDEIMVFASSGRLLRGGVPATGSLLILRDFEQATRLALDPPIDDEKLPWTDLRELQMSKVLGAAYAQSANWRLRELESHHMTALFPVVRRALRGKHAEIVDDVVADLCNCACNRAINGATGFFEQLFEAYRLGGWPCDWSGTYPEGQLTVYSPD